MSDNIYTRVYGTCMDIYSIPYADLMPSVPIGSATYVFTLVIPGPNAFDNATMQVIQRVYNTNGTIILTNASYQQISHLNKSLDVASPGLTETVAYYGITKNTHGDVFQYYFPFNECCDISRAIECGVGVEQVLAWMNLTNSKKLQALVPSKLTVNGPNELTALASAQNFTFQAFGIDPLPYYYGTQSGVANVFAVNYTVYNAHSLTDGNDYYYIENEGIFAFENSYAQPYEIHYNGLYNKVEEWYGWVTEMYTEVKDSSVIILRPAPATSEQTNTITSGISWNLGGSFSVNQSGATGTISGGISVDNSRSVSVDAITIYNRSNRKGIGDAGWRYDLRKTDSKFSFFSYGQVELITASNTGHSTFTPFNQWIWKITPDVYPGSDEVTIVINLIIDINSSIAYLDYPFHTTVQDIYLSHPLTYTFNAKKPPLPTPNFI